MKFVRVESLPERRRERGCDKVRELLDNFIASDMKCAQVILDPGDYSTNECARQSLNRARRAGRYPVNIITRNGELYIVRKDV